MKKTLILGLIAVLMGFAGVQTASAAAFGYGGGGGGGSCAYGFNFQTGTCNPTAVTPLTPAVGQVLGASTFHFTTYLHQGMSGDAVKQLQERLRGEGYFTFHTSTGYFGPITLASVKAYQTAHGIISTGYVGPLTIAALNAAPVVTNSVCPNGKTFASNCTSK